MTTKIFLKSKLQAILIKKSDLRKSKGINFFTSYKFPFQLASIKHSRGHIIIPHRHNKFLRKIYSTSEVLFLLSGKVKINFFDNQNKFFKSLNLNTGEIIIFFNGAHGFEIKKNSHLIEVKQGPYLSSFDKKIISNKKNV